MGNAQEINTSQQLTNLLGEKKLESLNAYIKITAEEKKKFF